MGTYSSGDLTYCVRLWGMDYVDEGDRKLYDHSGGFRAPDLKERWEASGMEWEPDLFLVKDVTA